MSEFAFRLRELSAAATPGPWSVAPESDEDGNSDILGLIPLDWPLCMDVNEVDATLIVYLRNHAEDIAAVIEAAENATHWAHGPGDPCPGCKMRAALRALGEPK